MNSADQATLDEFNNAVLEVLGERGDDYIYKQTSVDDTDFTCVYNPGNFPGHDVEPCLYGAAFRKLGISVPGDCEGLAVGMLMREYVKDARDDLEILRVHTEAQVAQDMGHDYALVRKVLVDGGVL